MSRGKEHAVAYLRSALRHTVRARCKAALPFPPDCKPHNKALIATDRSLDLNLTRTNELTGKMKLVSGGSSSVNVSIQFSRSAIGCAVNVVFSYKRGTEQNEPMRSSSTQPH